MAVKTRSLAALARDDGRPPGRPPSPPGSSPSPPPSPGSTKALVSAGVPEVEMPGAALSQQQLPLQDQPMAPPHAHLHATLTAPLAAPSSSSIEAASNQISAAPSAFPAVPIHISPCSHQDLLTCVSMATPMSLPFASFHQVAAPLSSPLMAAQNLSFPHAQHPSFLPYAPIPNLTSLAALSNPLMATSFTPALRTNPQGHEHPLQMEVNLGFNNMAGDEILPRPPAMTGFSSISQGCLNAH